MVQNPGHLVHEVVTGNATDEVDVELDRATAGGGDVVCVTDGEGDGVDLGVPAVGGVRLVEDALGEGGRVGHDLHDVGGAVLLVESLVAGRARRLVCHIKRGGIGHGCQGQEESDGNLHIVWVLW